MIAELFPTRIRYSGASIAYQLTSIVAGSLAPIIALWLYRELRFGAAGGDLCRHRLRDQRPLRLAGARDEGGGASAIR